MSEPVRVFVSYARQDDEFCQRLVKDLRAAFGGEEDAVWYDSADGPQIRAELWSRIEAELTARPIFMLILSPDALASHRVMAEFEFALREQTRTVGRRFIPVLVRPCELPMRMTAWPVVSVINLPYEAALAAILASLHTSEAQRQPASSSTHRTNKLFISYRRDDSADASGRIYDRLAPKYGRDNVFQDVDTIPLGVDFRSALTDEVAKCDVMLVVIGRQWVSITDEHGQRRLDNPGDFVRIEVEAALERGIPVIPILVQNAPMPQERDLPASLAPLAYRNGFAIRSGPYFHTDMDLLIGRLNALLIPVPVSPVPKPVPIEEERRTEDGYYLRRERQRRGWSQAELAQELGVARESIGRWERGVIRPPEQLIEKLCRLYGKTAEELGF